MRTSIALVSSLAMCCAGMMRESQETSSSYTPEQVRLVQRSLNERGYAMDLTGVYDQHTRAAVIDFQRSHGITATGELDAATARALGFHPSDVLPVRDREWLQDRLQEDSWRGGGG